MAQVVPVEHPGAYFSARNFAGGLAVIARHHRGRAGDHSARFPGRLPGGVRVRGGAGRWWPRVSSPGCPRSAYGDLGGRRPGRSAGAGRPSAGARSLAGGPAARALHAFHAAPLRAQFRRHDRRAVHPVVPGARAWASPASRSGLVVSVEMVVNIVMQRVYGSVADSALRRLPRDAALRLATALVPMAWVFVRDPLGGALASIVAGMVWSGHDLAAFQRLAGRHAARTAARTTWPCTRWPSALCGALGPALAAVLVDAIGYQALFAAVGSIALSVGRAVDCAGAGLGSKQGKLNSYGRESR